MTQQEIDLMAALKRADQLYREWCGSLKSGDMVMTATALEYVTEVRNPDDPIVMLDGRSLSSFLSYRSKLSHLRPPTDAERAQEQARAMRVQLGRILLGDEMGEGPCLPTEKLHAIEALLRDHT